jgi:hypothetical protein
MVKRFYERDPTGDVDRIYQQLLKDAPAVKQLRNLARTPEVAHQDFLARADTLGALGFDVLISRFEHDYEIAEYLSAYSDKLIGFAIGLPTVKKLIEETFYSHLAGGVLEAIGRLYKRSVKAYIYPSRDSDSGRVENLDDVVMPAPWHHLHRLLRDLGRVEPVRTSNETWLSIQQEQVLSRINRGDASWESMVPAKVAQIIKSKELFRSAVS